jgi:L-ascorbate metabolism protein UlaG (beta-lactamase superfamily)
MGMVATQIEAPQRAFAAAMDRLSLPFIGLLSVTSCGPDAPANDGGEDASEPSGITLEYIAHASFVVTGPDGARVLIDPYASRVWLGYDFPEGVTADAVVVTHPHYDHDAGAFRGAQFPWPDTPLLEEPGDYTVGGMRVLGVEGRHADPYGKEFGQINTIFVIEAGGLRIAHLGDNGPLTDTIIRQMGAIDVLMIPGDALYHILSPDATRAAIDALDPKLVIPMHYRIGALETEAASPSDLGDLEPWLEGRGRVLRPGTNRYTLAAGDLPDERSYLVLEHSTEIPVNR